MGSRSFKGVVEVVRAQHLASPVGTTESRDPRGHLPYLVSQNPVGKRRFERGVELGSSENVTGTPVRTAESAYARSQEKTSIVRVNLRPSFSSVTRKVIWRRHMHARNLTSFSISCLSRTGKSVT